MQRLGKLWWVPVLALALLLPATAQGEVYFEAYMGGVAAANDATSFRIGPRPNLTNVMLNVEVPGVYDNPFFQGGLKLGTWFVPEGFLGFNYPRWMKYLGFYLDFSYHRLNQQVSREGTLTAWNTAGVVTYNSQFNPDGTLRRSGTTWKCEGHAATLAFMFAARYGFLPDPEVPFGRLQPYVAVGPAILFTGQAVKFVDPNGIYSVVTGAQSVAVICLAVEAGVRYMALKNVSLDASFKYRFAQPSFSYSFPDINDGRTHEFTLNRTYNLFSFQVGAAYHF
jgi:opacity protein-like surface antigen